MRLNRVKGEVTELKSFVDSWVSTPSEEQLAAALAMVKEIYSELRFCGEEDEVEVSEIAEVAETPEVTEVTEKKPQSEEELRRERLQNIKSLYGETKPAEPVVPATPAEPVVPVVSVDPKDPIASMLTINDRFLLSNDLFDGNMVLLNNTLQELDNQPSLDDALLYIAQNYHWNGDSEGAKLLYTLLKKRF